MEIMVNEKPTSNAHTDASIESTPPGSLAAMRLGCTCPILDNMCGKGLGGDGRRFGWVINDDCPLHGTKNND